MHLNLETTGYIFTDHSQEHSLSFSAKMQIRNVTQLQELRHSVTYIQMLLNMEKAGDLDKESEL